MKKKRSEQDTIIWAVDPDFVYDDESTIIRCLLAWSQKLNCRVQPVSVVSAESMKILPIDRDLVSSYLQDFFPPDFKRPEIIISPQSSTRRRAYSLAEYALKNNARYIFVNSRDKPSWNPFHLGGFAEALLATALTPVFILNERANLNPFDSPILFPTDFSSGSRGALEEVSGLAEKCAARVFIYNQVEWGPRFIYKIGHHEKDFSIGYQKGLREERLSQGLKWAADLRISGIHAEVVVRGRHRSLAEDIVEEAKEIHAGLIVMATERGHIAQSVLGSSVRDVILLASCPLLVVKRPQLEMTRHYFVEEGRM